MRILALFPRRPWPIRSGADHRAFHLLSRLARSWEVDAAFLTASTSDPCPLDSLLRRSQVLDHRFPPWPSLSQNLLRERPATIRHWWGKAAQERFRSFRGGRDYELFLAEDIAVLPYFEASAASPPVVVDRTRVDHAFQSEELRARLEEFSGRERLSRRLNIAKLRSFERQVARIATLQVVCSPSDARAIAELSAGAATLVIPNGVEPCDAPPAERSRPAQIVMTGCLDYAPNTQGLHWFLDRVWPRIRRCNPEAQLCIAGRHPPKDLGPRIRRAGGTLLPDVEDIASIIARAEVVIAPILIGGGSRLKIVEAWNQERAVVSTSRGLDGLEGRSGLELLVADDPDSFAAAVSGLLDDPLRRRKIAAAGRRRLLSRYDWDHLIESWKEGVRSAVSRPSIHGGIA